MILVSAGQLSEEASATVMEKDSEAEKTASAGPIINIDNDNKEIFEPSSVIRKMKSSSLCWKFLFFKEKEGKPQMS